MALPNLSGSNIQDTFQRVLHTNGSTLFNGTGSAVSSLNLDVNQFTANGDAQFYNPTVFQDSIEMQGDINLVGDISASGTITAGDIVNHSNTTSGLRFNPTSTDVLSNLIVSGSVTASGNISASGVIKGAEFQSQDQTVGKYDTGLNAITLGYNTDIPIRIGKGNPNITISGNITASGDISASGDLYFNKIDGGTF